jgi:AcrR family transcriptional regulator
MSASRTARERARAELTDEIKGAARRQLVEVGPGQLSLRAVARELGMASSAVYRYFPSRDDLLTALIIDSYDAIGAAVEAASDEARPGRPRARWVAACRGARTWALAHPHEYALLYGTPVPGYQAPQDTVPPASRVPLALVEPVHQAYKDGGLWPAFPGPDMSPGLEEQAHKVAALIAPGLPEDAIARALIAWSQLFGMLTFELFGQFVGSVEPADEFFEHAVDQMADFVGLVRHQA